ncbi:MAG: hydantoinase/oxoprolinase family protein [Haloferacaceae archaeon]
MSAEDRTTVDVDIGGTFTDCFVRRDGTNLATGKAETTDHDLSVGFLNAVERAAAELGLDRDDLLAEAGTVRYSTTVALNDLIERQGTRLGLLVTEGWEDTVRIGRGSQWSDGLSVQEKRNVARAEKPEPLVPPELTAPVKERVNADGEVVRPLDEAHVREQVGKLIDAGARAFVVSLGWSFRNDAHEQRVREIIQEEYPDAYLGSAPVFLSSEVNPKRGEYERTMTALLNAYLHRNLVDELYGIGDKLRAAGYEQPLMMIHNTGGTAEVFRTAAIDTFNGGPVAALIGSGHLGEKYGFENVVAADMGGTSFDLSIIVQGSTRVYDREPVIDRWRVNTAMLETKSIGAGGGSIASVDSDLGELSIGPESAGANPGPACYNQGGRKPTVTDADLVLGYINPENFHGGDKSLSERRAKRAIRREVAGPLDMEIEEAAALIRQIVDANMGNTIYKETALKGYDPRDFVMFGFGGAGPGHAADVARAAEIGTVVTFPYASVFSAFGSSVMDAVHIYERSRTLALLDPASGEYFSDVERFNEVVDDLRERAVRDFEGEGHDPADVQFSLELDVKYGGQIDVTRVASPHLRLGGTDDVADVCEAFEAEYADAYSPISTSPESGIEVENFVLKGTAPRETPPLPTHETAGPDPSHARTGEREVYWTVSESFEPTPIYAEPDLRAGNVIEGPAIVEATDTTISVPPDATYRLDESRTGLMELE